MGIVEYDLHLGETGGNGRPLPRLEVPGHRGTRFQHPPTYQPWTHDGRGVLLALHGGGTVLFDVETGRSESLPSRTRTRDLGVAACRRWRSRSIGPFGPGVNGDGYSPSSRIPLARPRDGADAHRPGATSVSSRTGSTSASIGRRDPLGSRGSPAAAPRRWSPSCCLDEAGSVQPSSGGSRCGSTRDRPPNRVARTGSRSLQDRARRSRARRRASSVPRTGRAGLWSPCEWARGPRPR